MMHKEEILSKGSYVHPQTPDLVSVKQYVVTRIKDKKVLFVRLNNERGETVDSVSLSVRQYNVKGELIGTDKVKLKKLNAPAYSVFAPTTPIVLSEDCSDFKIDVLSASYGDYTYDVIDGEAHIRYKKQKPETKKRVNTDALMADMGGRKHSVSRKSLKAPMLVCTLVPVPPLAKPVSENSPTQSAESPTASLTSLSKRIRRSLDPFIVTVRSDVHSSEVIAALSLRYMLIGKARERIIAATHSVTMRSIIIGSIGCFLMLRKICFPKMLKP